MAMLPAALPACMDHLANTRQLHASPCGKSIRSPVLLLKCSRACSALRQMASVCSSGCRAFAGVKQASGASQQRQRATAAPRRPMRVSATASASEVRLRA